MSTPNIIEHLGLQKLPADRGLKDLMRHGNSNSYLLDEKDQIIGLNLRGKALKDTDLDFLTYLPELEALNVSENELTEVIIPPTCSRLRYLNLNKNPELRSVQLPDNLPYLKELYIQKSQLQQIEVPKGLASLEMFFLDHNKLKSIVFQAACPRLHLLDISHNQLSRFQLLSGFDALTDLYLNNNLLRKLDFKGSLPHLETLHLGDNQLNKIPLDFLHPFPNLINLYLPNNPLPSTIKSFVESEWDFDIKPCLSAIQKIIKDLRAGKDLNNEYKLLVIGNGNVGKSCMVKRLVEDDFEEEWDSTHGIIICAYSLGKYELQIWDFGGQDIYHATHRLFMQSDALYLLLWDVHTERSPHTHRVEEGIPRQYRNYPLPYWLHYAQHQGKGSPILLVRTKKELETHREFSCQRFITQYKKRFSNWPHIAIDSQIEEDDEEDRDNGFEDLKDEVGKTIRKYFKHKRFEVANTWAKLREKLRQKRQAGVKRLDKTAYLALAKEVEKELDNIFHTDPIDILSNWLHPTGVVFYQSGLFDSSIILDQQWVIDKVYVLFKREYKKRKSRLRLTPRDYIERRNGAFTGEDLMEFWPDDSREECELYTRFMLSCEMCFEVTPKSKEEERNITFEERAFVAPQLMPREANPNVRDYWENRPALYFRYTHEFLHYGVIQSFIVRTQSLAEIRDIWQQGISLKADGQRALIEVVKTEKGSSIQIRLTENAQPLLDAIRGTLEGLQQGEGEESVSRDGKNFVLLQELKDHNLEQSTTIRCQNGRYILVEPLLLFLEKDERASMERLIKDRSESQIKFRKSIESLEKRLVLLMEKKNYFNEEKAISSSPDTRFELQKRIKKLERDIELCKKEMEKNMLYRGRRGESL